MPTKRPFNSSTPKGKTKRPIWAYRSNDLERGPPIVVFDCFESVVAVSMRAISGGWRATDGRLITADTKSCSSGVRDFELACSGIKSAQVL